jgi:hypothetical protein
MPLSIAAMSALHRRSRVTEVPQACGGRHGELSGRGVGLLGPSDPDGSQST